MRLCFFCLKWNGAHRVLYLLTTSFPTRRASDLLPAGRGADGDRLATTGLAASCFRFGAAGALAGFAAAACLRGAGALATFFATDAVLAIGLAAFFAVFVAGAFFAAAFAGAGFAALPAGQVGSAHVGTPGTTAHSVCRIL